jgi:hypothetical protein
MITIDSPVSTEALLTSVEEIMLNQYLHAIKSSSLKLKKKLPENPVLLIQTNSKNGTGSLAGIINDQDKISRSIGVRQKLSTRISYTTLRSARIKPLIALAIFENRIEGLDDEDAIQWLRHFFTTTHRDVVNYYKEMSHLEEYPINPHLVFHIGSDDFTIQEREALPEPPTFFSMPFPLAHQAVIAQFNNPENLSRDIQEAYFKSSPLSSNVAKAVAWLPNSHETTSVRARQFRSYYEKNLSLINHPLFLPPTSDLVDHKRYADLLVRVFPSIASMELYEALQYLQYHYEHSSVSRTQAILEKIHHDSITVEKIQQATSSYPPRTLIKIAPAILMMLSHVGSKQIAQQQCQLFDYQRHIEIQDILCLGFHLLPPNNLESYTEDSDDTTNAALKETLETLYNEINEAGQNTGHPVKGLFSGWIDALTQLQFEQAIKYALLNEYWNIAGCLIEQADLTPQALRDTVRQSVPLQLAEQWPTWILQIDCKPLMVAFFELFPQFVDSPIPVSIPQTGHMVQTTTLVTLLSAIPNITEHSIHQTYPLYSHDTFGQWLTKQYAHTDVFDFFKEKEDHTFCFKLPDGISVDLFNQRVLAGDTFYLERIIGNFGLKAFKNAIASHLKTEPKHELPEFQEASISKGHHPRYILMLMLHHALKNKAYDCAFALFKQYGSLPENLISLLRNSDPNVKDFYELLKKIFLLTCTIPLSEQALTPSDKAQLDAIRSMTYEKNCPHYLGMISPSLISPLHTYLTSCVRRDNDLSFVLYWANNNGRALYDSFNVDALSPFEPFLNLTECPSDDAALILLLLMANYPKAIARFIPILFTNDTPPSAVIAGTLIAWGHLMPTSPYWRPCVEALSKLTEEDAEGIITIANPFILSERMQDTNYMRPLVKTHPKASTQEKMLDKRYENTPLAKNARYGTPFFRLHVAFSLTKIFNKHIAAAKIQSEAPSAEYKARAILTIFFLGRHLPTARDFITRHLKAAELPKVSSDTLWAACWRHLITLPPHLFHECLDAIMLTYSETLPAEFVRLCHASSTVHTSDIANAAKSLYTIGCVELELAAFCLDHSSTTLLENISFEAIHPELLAEKIVEYIQANNIQNTQALLIQIRNSVRNEKPLYEALSVHVASLVSRQQPLVFGYQAERSQKRAEASADKPLEKYMPTYCTIA